MKSPYCLFLIDVLRILLLEMSGLPSIHGHHQMLAFSCIKGHG
jgi:hypothetical protein